MAIDEAKRVITERSHPLHERYANGDPEIVRQVTQAYERAYPGEVEIDGDTRLQNLINGKEF